MPFVGKSKFAKSYRGKNGYSSAFIKIKTNEGYKWKRNAGPSRPPRKKK